MNFVVVKYVFFGLLLLFLFHFESLNIFGPVKLSHLWKGFLLLFLLIDFLNSKKKQFYIYKPLIWLSLLQLLNQELFNNTFNAFLFFGTTLILPLLGVYFLKLKPNQLQKMLLFFSSFFILSFVPYKIGVLNSINDGYDLSSFSDSSDASGLIGPFQTVHSASTALAGAIVVIVFFWFKKSYNRVYLTSLLLIGSYFLISTYVRTGLLMVVVGILPMIIYFSRKNFTTRLQLLLFSVLMAAFVSSWVLTNETLMNRVKGESKFNSEFESIDNLGSGRGKLLFTSFEIYGSSNLMEQILGTGVTKQTAQMKEEIGYAIMPHNGFLTLLLINGFLGLMFFMFFLRNIIKYLKMLSKEGRIFLRALIFSYIIMTFFQNYDMLYMYLMLVLGIAYTNTKYKLQRFNTIK